MNHALQEVDSCSSANLTPEYLRGVGRNILDSIPKTKINDYPAVLRVGQLFELFLTGIEIACRRSGGRIRSVDVMRAEMDEVYQCVADMKFVALTDFVFEVLPGQVRNCLDVLDAVEKHQNRRVEVA